MEKGSEYLWNTKSSDPKFIQIKSHRVILKKIVIFITLDYSFIIENDRLFFHKIAKKNVYVQYTGAHQCLEFSSV